MPGAVGIRPLGTTLTGPVPAPPCLVPSQTAAQKLKRLYLVWGLYIEVELGLGLAAEHPHAYVACVGVLGCPLTHLCLQEYESIVSECDSSALHCEIASSGTR